MIELTAGKDDSGRRLDRILRKVLPDLSLSLIHRLLRQKKILIDSKPATPSHRIEQGMVIRINAPVTRTGVQVNGSLVNQKKSTVNENKSLNSSFLIPHSSFSSPVPILWQGAGIIIFNKPVGLSTHGPQSLDAIVNAELADTLPRSLSFRPGPLHRLDKPTSGAIVFSQTLEGAKMFSALLRERKLEKVYLAIVEGRIEKSEEWRDALERDEKTRKSFVNLIPNSSFLIPNLSNEAVTTVKPLAANDNYSLIEAHIKTGRHHQIRAQAGSHGHPLAGDIKYGAGPPPGNGKTRGGEFFLHAWKISSPDIPGFPGSVTAPPPQAFLAQIEALFGKRLVAHHAY